MPKPNEEFKLDQADIQLIEDCLRDSLKSTWDMDYRKRVDTLLAKLHNQKEWYRPKEGYISG